MDHTGPMPGVDSADPPGAGDLHLLPPPQPPNRGCRSGGRRV